MRLDFFLLFYIFKLGLMIVSYAVHRLTASLAFLVRLSPFYDAQISPLLDVLQTRAVLERKLMKGGCGEAGVSKKEVRKLVEEVATKLCP